jgi:cobalt/nickel transport system permease protein
MMLRDWLGHHHDHTRSLIHRTPAGVKLAVALGIILVTVVIPGDWHGWFLSIAALLLTTVWVARIPLLFLAKRFAVLSTFVLGVVVVNAFQPTMRSHWYEIAARGCLCLLTVLVLSNTTPFSKVLGVLRRARVPSILVTTLALMHRYLFVLMEESERMRRARASRSFVRRRRMHWRILGSVVGHLFLRASERAERIYAAMCARGWK